MVKRRSNLYKYIYISLTIILLVVHFVFFVRINSCEVSNTGFAFGILNSTDSIYPILISISMLVLIFLTILLIRKTFNILPLASILLLSMGIFFDKISNGVCDYISFLNFPVFNLLDLGIVLNICLIFAGIIKNIWKKYK